MTVRQQRKSFPKCQIHKASNRAFIWWRDKRHCLGGANSSESFEAYNQFIAEFTRKFTTPISGRSTRPHQPCAGEEP